MKTLWYSYVKVLKATPFLVEVTPSEGNCDVAFTLKQVSNEVAKIHFKRVFKDILPVKYLERSVLSSRGLFKYVY